MSYDLSDYVDVAERIRVFKEKYPEGCLQSELDFEVIAGAVTGVTCRAYAFRTADDERPGIGHAYEPIPGKTPYTRDSEVMNAETSAWGRAIVALGFETKKIASRQEVLNRSGAEDTTATGRENPAASPHSEAGGTVAPDNPAAKAQAAQQAAKAARAPDSADPGDMLVGFGKHANKKLNEVPKPYLEWIIKNVEGTTEHKRQVLARSYVLLGRESEYFGGDPDDGIPF